MSVILLLEGRNLGGVHFFLLNANTFAFRQSTDFFQAVLDLLQLSVFRLYLRRLKEAFLLCLVSRRRRIRDLFFGFLDVTSQLPQTLFRLADIHIHINDYAAVRGRVCHLDHLLSIWGSE